MLRMGLVGCGTHANWAVAPAIKASGKWELAAVCDVNPDNLARIDAPGAVKFNDHRVMLRDGGLDGVYVATLANTHAAITIDALAAGKHVVCEKPMAESVEQCRAMVDAARAASRVLAINFETRYHPCNRRILDILRAGKLGRVEAIHLQNFWDGHKNFGGLAARRKRLVDLAGGLDCGIHKLDLARHFAGGDWREIHAMGRWFGEDVAQPPHISILASLTSGVMVTLNASLGYTAQIQPKHYCDVLTIVGDKGIISVLDDRSGPAHVKVVCETLEEEFDHNDPGHGNVMAILLADVAGVASGVKPRSQTLFADGEDGLAAQWITAESNRQAHAGRPKAFA